MIWRWLARIAVPDGAVSGSWLTSAPPTPRSRFAALWGYDPNPLA